jgi:hypothetical protein
METRPIGELEDRVTDEELSQINWRDQAVSEG